MKKVLSLFTVAVMLIAMFAVMGPVAVSADAENVGTAEELQSVITKINSGELPQDTDITLTADIDLSNVTGWKPLKIYKGTFDGAGHTVKNLTHAVTIENNDSNKLDGGSNTGEYIISTEEFGMYCFGQVGMALLVVKGEGATLKNFTLKDSSLTVKMNFNKNWQPFYGGVAAYLEGGSISDVKLENVDIPVCDQAGINQGYLGFAGLLAGATSGVVTIANCSIDADSTLDASANKKFNVAAYVGRHSSESPITMLNCTTAAAVSAAPDVSDKSGLMYTNDDAMLGGVATGFVAFVNEGANVVLLDCENSGALSGAEIANLSGVESYDSLTSEDNSKNGVQFHENGTDARIVLEGVTALLEDYETMDMVITFEKKDGSIGTLTQEITAVYDYVTAAGELITASEGYSLTGVVVTGIDRSELASISVSVVLNGMLEVPIGTATIE